MKNIKIIVTALAVALNACNGVSAMEVNAANLTNATKLMNVTNLINTLKSYIPLWISNNNPNELKLDTYSPGDIEPVIEQLRLQLRNAANPKEITGLFSEYEKHREIFDKMTNTLINEQVQEQVQATNPGFIARLFSGGRPTDEYVATVKGYLGAFDAVKANPAYKEAVEKAEAIKDSIASNQQTISCLSQLQQNTKTTYNFVSNNIDQLQKITPEYLAKNPEAQKLAQSAVEHLKKPSEAFSQCMNSTSINAYQNLVPNTAADAESIQNALNKVAKDNEWLYERWGATLKLHVTDWVNWGSTKLGVGHESLDELSRAFNKLHPAVQYTAMGIAALGVIYGVYALTTRKPSAKKFLSRLGYGAVAIAGGAVAIGVIVIALNGMTLTA